MKKNKIASMIIGAVSMVGLAVSPGVAMASTDHGNSNAGNNITICHATGSVSNPYVRISPNANGVIHGHVGHQDGRDIIPPFSYNDHGSVKYFAGQNWDVSGQAIYNNGCKVEGGHGGGPQKDCDGDYDNSPASDCQKPQKDCDGDYDHSPASDCTPPPQKDCDGDYDHSPASDCTQPQPQKDCDGDYDSSPSSECTTGGMGGGPTGGTTSGTTTTTTTTSSHGQVLGASTTAVGGLGAGPQVAVVPSGSVNGGEGAAARTTSTTSLVGLMGSLIGVGTGLSLLNRKQN